MTPDIPAAGDARIQPVCEARLHDGRSYAIAFVRDVLGDDATWRSLLAGRRALLVAPTEVWQHYGGAVEALRDRAGLDLRTLVLDLDEAAKTLDTVAAIAAACHDHELGRTDVLVAFGGGVCSDVVGVTSSLVRRGIGCIRVPTTLIGQIDAGVGIKGGLNFLGSKSYLGCFKPPEVVLLDPGFLPTSPLRSLLDGVAEAVKIALICDPELFDLVERHGPGLVRSRFRGDAALVREVVSRAAARMVEQLAPNFFEDQTWLRQVDLGHTFSSLIESRSGYRTSHGQAVAIDMAFSTSLAVTLGMAPPATFERIARVLTWAGLPVDSPLLSAELCDAAIHAACLHRGGAPNLVVPCGVGDCRFVTARGALTANVFEAALARLRRARPAAARGIAAAERGSAAS